MKRLETALSANHDAVMTRLASALEKEPQAPRPAPELSPRHMKYYRNDEDIFEPAPQAQGITVPDLTLLPGLPPEPVAEMEPPAKRRIVIIRHKPGEQIDVPLADDLAKAS